jgi:hypothetical protein
MNLFNSEKTMEEQVIDNVAPEAIIIMDGLIASIDIDETFEGHETVDQRIKYVRDLHLK